MSKDKTGWNKYRRGPVRRDTDTLTVTIDSLSNSGEGIGRHDGQVVFVPLTLPGERVKAKVSQRKKNLIRATLSDILTPAPERLIPPCQWFGHCGGCDWQHAPYIMQLQAKEAHLSDALHRIGQLNDIPVRPIVASPEPYHYRNRIRGVIKNERFHYTARGSNQLVAVSSCAIADSAINKILAEPLQSNLEGRVEISVDGEQVTIQALDEENSTQDGFRQVNTAISQQLNNMLQQLTERYQGGNYVDLYCGTGTWSINMAQRHRASNVVGVDSSEANIRIAKRNAGNAGLHNVRFKQGRVEKLLSILSLQNSLCIVDPPRAGLATDVCTALCANPPELILYISCHPASLARDLARLTDTQFLVDSITPMDMFPQTAHLECLTVLSRQ